MVRLEAAVFALSLSASAMFGQAPVPAAVVNPASNTPAGLPNSGVAQGSIIVVYGSNLGPAALVQAPSLPLPTTAGLGGTSVQITVGGTTVTAPLVYTLATQVAAVLPSTAPVGTGTLSVTFNGQTGVTPIQVVKSNFGISTLNQSGAGPAVVTRPDYSVISLTNSAKPGETLVLWGTGLGPIVGNDAAAPAGGDLGTPIQVYVGGQVAAVSYRGRSGAPGLDQINFAMPNVSGCYVSLVVQTGSTVSNFTTIPVAANGGTCTDSTGPSLTGLPTTGGSVRIGGVVLEQITTTTPAIGPLPASTKTLGFAVANFEKIDLSALTQSGSISGQPSIGGCIVDVYRSSAATTVTPTITSTGLNAGAAISIQGPLSLTLNSIPNSIGEYIATSTSSIPAGSYIATNGSGGPDVGAFSAPLTIVSPLNWTNQANASTVDRTQPFPISWTGGDPSSYVVISGSSLVTGTTVDSTIGATFTCTAQVSAGKFTIPSPVLLSLPASTPTVVGSFSIPTGNLTVASYSNPNIFKAPGLDYAYTFFSSGAGITMTYK